MDVFFFIFIVFYIKNPVRKHFISVDPVQTQRSVPSEPCLQCLHNTRKVVASLKFYSILSHNLGRSSGHHR